MNWVKKDKNPEANLSVLERVGFSLGNAGNCLGLCIFSYFLLYFYTNVAGLSAGIVATIMLVSRVFDGITDLTMGYIVDRTRSPKGKARVWVLRGSIPYALAIVLIFLVPTGASDMVKYIFVFLTYNLANAITGTIVNTSYNSMTSLITKNPMETTLLGIFSIMASSIASLVVAGYTLRIVGALGGDLRAWRITMVGYAVLACLLLLACYATTTERVVETEKAKEKPLPMKIVLKNLLNNKYWIMIGISYILIMFIAGSYGSSLVYYCESILGDMKWQTSITNATTYPSLLATIGAFLFVKKFGKGGTFRIGAAVQVLSLVGRAAVGANPTIQVVLGVVYGIGSGLAGAGILGILADTVEYGQWKNGVRIVGSAFAVMSFAAKIGQGLGSSLVGWLIEWGGYDAALTVQSASALTSIKTCFIYLPLIMSILMFVIMMFYDLDKKIPQIIAENREKIGEE